MISNLKHSTIKNLKHTLLLLAMPALLCAFNPATKYVQKAETSVEKGNIIAAKKYYLKAIEIDSFNVRANAGFGLLLCELLDSYSEALPYLETAYESAGQDSMYDVMYAMGKCHEHSGRYERALGFYERLTGVEDIEKDPNLRKELKKRKEDCKYGILHSSDLPNENLYIVNAGKTINTDMPEYVPVITPQNHIIFTSKRRDSRNERLNWLDGKYFESMYIGDIAKNGFNNIRRYTLPDKFLSSQYKKNHEAVVSISQDGKKLFTFKNSDIYEADMNELDQQNPRKLLTTFSDAYYQNHAFLTKDGRTLYFTSDADGGLGGLDIYKSVKGDDGQWGKPENMGAPINSEYDEDAPFISRDGITLFFSSKGHPGFGSYDIYKCTLENGKWTAPENVGLPLNSAGHDIFLVEDTTQANAYFSSGRDGGFGDMDIYKVVYLDKINYDCPPLASNPMISIEISDDDSSDYSNKAELKRPANYKTLNSEWKINDRFVGLGEKLVFNYKQPGSYKIHNKSLFYCDTCLTPVLACNEVVNQLRKIKPHMPATVIGNSIIIGGSNRNEGSSGAGGSTIGGGNSSGSGTSNSGGIGGGGGSGPGGGPGNISGSGTFNINNIEGALSTKELMDIGFETSPVLFDFDKSTLRWDAIKTIKKNLVVFKTYPDLKLHLIGYTDSRGPDSYNLRYQLDVLKVLRDTC